MDIINNEGFEFFHQVQGNFHIVFFTAAGERSFNINSEEGKNNIEKVKGIFDLEDVGYCIQTHSDIVWNYDGKVKQGDSIITDAKNIGLGVFTADCVPVIIYDEINKVIAAVHSGWKGTYEEITYKTVKRMESDYGSKAEELQIFIGPHIRECCYEVGSELAQKFKEKGYNYEIINEDTKLNLENCIKSQCIKAGVSLNKVNSINCCTKCNDKYKFFSYRKNKTAGRLFSLAFIKE
jgi:YfiH family protein